jgi:hypothetical protein
MAGAPDAVVSQPTMAAPTVRQVATTRALGLRVLAGRARLDRPVRGVHVADLDHPGRYVRPGEAVLTNGLWLERVAAAEWVGEIAAAGASALGFGVSDFCPVVPEPVVEACEAAGLPLVEVPGDLSFSHVADAVADRVARDQERLYARQLERTRMLLEAATADDGYAALARLLRRDVGRACAFVAADGEVLAAAGGRPRTSDLLAAIEAARAGALPAPVGRLTAVPVPTHDGHGSILVMDGDLADLDEARRLEVEQVAAYAAVPDERRRERRRALEALAGELLALVESGDMARPAQRARLAALGLDPDRPFTVVVGPDRDVFRDALAASGVATASSGDGALRIALVQPDGAAAAAACVGQAARLWSDDPALGASLPVAPGGDLRLAIAEAQLAYARALAGSPGRRVVEHEGFDSHRLLLAAMPPAVADDFRARVLGPLERWDAAHGTELVVTVRTFLAHGGHWRETAGLLGIHPNTLKHRLRRVAELTGRRIEETADRVDLWLALEVDRRRTR